MMAAAPFISFTFTPQAVSCNYPNAKSNLLKLPTLHWPTNAVVHHNILLFSTHTHTRGLFCRLTTKIEIHSGFCAITELS